MPSSRALSRCVLTLAASLLAAAGTAKADEGMWPPNEFPFERFEKAYGFRPTQEWLDHVRLSSVRFNSGGSGSFVSADGLAITNQHVGSDCVQKLSSAEHDLVTEGFVAGSPEEELPCPDLELNVLESIERVTERVRSAGAGKDAAAAEAARRAERAAVEKECQEATGLRCNVVELYQGGEFDLYRYRRYTDIRLAFAPETQLAFFGGDPDNFEYPRFAMDAALFRVWEDGKPAKIEHYLTFSAAGPREGEVTFISGNPGSTSRLDTLANLTWLRDLAYPFRIERYLHERDRLLAFAARGDEQRRIAFEDLSGLENALKGTSGYLSGLLDEGLLSRNGEQEAALRAHLAAHPELAEEIGDPWRQISDALETYRGIYARFQLLEGDFWGAGRLASIGRLLVRLAEEEAKPNGERLPYFRETARPSLLQQLYSEAPIYPEYEELQLVGALERLRSHLGPTHPLVIEVLGDLSPAQLARQVVAGTRLAEVAERKRLVAGGSEAIQGSTDPMIRLARQIEPLARELLDTYQKQVQAVTREAETRIVELYFDLHGRETYPDATFTLRLTYGKVAGYEEGGRPVPWHTTFGGMFERSQKFHGEAPFHLPKALAASRSRLDLSTPLDFVTTHDIHGGNSGSPVINRAGEFVGIVFDGNLWMLPNRFSYSDERARAISVDSRGILETLRKIYPAGHLADELLRGRLVPRVDKEVVMGR